MPAVGRDRVCPSACSNSSITLSGSSPRSTRRHKGIHSKPAAQYGGSKTQNSARRHRAASGTHHHADGTSSGIVQNRGCGFPDKAASGFSPRPDDGKLWEGLSAHQLTEGGSMPASSPALYTPTALTSNIAMGGSALKRCRRIMRISIRAAVCETVGQRSAGDCQQILDNHPPWYYSTIT